MFFLFSFNRNVHLSYSWSPPSIIALRTFPIMVLITEIDNNQTFVVPMVKTCTPTIAG
jgi:hypothetical protein